MSKILANQIANYADNSPIELKEGLNIPAGKELQAGGTFGTLGQVLSSTGTTIQWSTPFSGNYQDLSNKPTIPAVQIQSDWNATTGLAVIKNKPSIPGVPSVTVASASGGGNLSYNGGNGEFTYTPPDLSGYLTSLGDAAGVTTAKIGNWDTAYGWGNHASAGYLTSLALGGLSNVSSNAPSDGQVLKWNNANGEWEPGTDLTSASGSGIALTDLSTSTAAASGGGSLSYNNGTGVFTFAPADLTSFITAEADTLATVTGRGATTSTALTFNNDITFDGTTAGRDLAWDRSADALVFEDLTKLSFGSDLDISTDGTNVTLQSSGTSKVIINSAQVEMKSQNGNDYGFLMDAAGGCTLGHAGTSILETTATGVTISGSVTASGGNSSNWNTAYGWGDHGAGGYLTSLGTAILDGDFTSNGLMKRTGAGTYTIDSNTYLTDIVSDTTPELGGTLDMKTFTIAGPGGGSSKTLIGGDYGNFPNFFGHYQALGALGWQFRQDGTAICRADGPNSDGTSINAVKIGNFSDLSCLTIGGDGTVATDASVTAGGTITADAGFIVPIGTSNQGFSLYNGGSTHLTIHWSNSASKNYLSGDGNYELVIDNHSSVKIAATNAIELDYGATTRIETSNTGATITGALTAGGLTYPTANGTANDILTSDGAGNVNWSTPSASLSTRAEYTATTASIANNASGDITVVAYKSYALLKIYTSAAAWVTLYTDTTARTNDALRSETTDPTPGSGVIAEVITTGNQTQLITPGVVGFNNDGTPSTNVYAKVVNKSGGAAAITVGLTVIQLED